MKNTYRPIEGFKIKDPNMVSIYKQVSNYARHGQNCLLYGPTGSGKEFLARHFYEAFREANKPAGKFVPYNCADPSSSLVKSALFGHKKGAFTDASYEKPGLFEEAENGVLFLDEIGNLSREVQAMLLRAIDPGEASRIGDNTTYPTNNVVIIGATDQPPEELMPQLFYRLGHVVEVPCLDDRPFDIPPAVIFFVDKYLREIRNLASTTKNAKKEIIDCLIPLAQERSWPGNFRDLSTVINYAIIHADGYAEKEFLSKFKDFFIQRSMKENAIKKTTVVHPGIQSAIHSLDVTWKQEEKERWAEVLSGFGNKPFMRRDIDHLFSFQTRTAQDRINTLLEANILDYYKDRNDRFIVREPGEKKQGNIPSRDKIRSGPLQLPAIKVPPHEREKEIDEVITFLEKSDHVFLSGTPRSGKTTLALLVGSRLTENRDVYYHELQESGLGSFIQEMIEFLIANDYTQLKNLPFLTPFMLDTDAAALTGFADSYFSKMRNPVIILDNVHTLRTREDLNTLQVILKYWESLRFVFTGDKLNNELIFGEGINIVEYTIGHSNYSA